MNLDLPATIAAYFAAKNRHDIDGMLASFSDNAIVKDEGQTHEGRAAIRTWMEETTRKYAVHVEPQDASRSGGIHAVTGLVSGNFPGSPARLKYRFELSNDGVNALEIG